MIKTATAVLTLIAVLIAAYWWSQSRIGDVDPALQSIVQNYPIGPDGVIEDPTGALGVKGLEDITYTLEKRKLSITYGKQQFTINLDSYGEELAGYLNKLGISLQQSDEEIWLMKYKGKAVRQVE